MKELSIEDKAKRYDEAVKKLRDFYRDYDTVSRLIDVKEELAHLVPEIKESEDECVEKIKKDIISYLNNRQITSIAESNATEKWIAWLKKQGKQKPTDKVEPFDKYEGLTDFERTLADICIGWIGEELGWKQYIKDNADILLKIAIKKFNSIQDAHFEQKPIDKVEPKFHKGVWIVWQNKFYKVNDNGCGYELIDQNGLSTSLEYGTIDESARLWNIGEDAKDGDVLAAEDKDKVFLYNGKLDLRGNVCAHCGIYKTYDGLRFTEVAIGNYFTYKEPHPATKEQRDTLEKAMADAGYTFDFEKKELKKIEQKPAWSEEDEYKYNTILHHLDLRKEKYKKECNQEEQDRYQCLYDWLKSLKQRIKE